MYIKLICLFSLILSSLSVQGQVLQGGVLQGGSLGEPLRDEIDAAKVLGFKQIVISERNIGIAPIAGGTNMFIWGDLSGYGNDFTARVTRNTTNAAPYLDNQFTNRYGAHPVGFRFTTNELTVLSCDGFAPQMSGSITNFQDFSFILCSADRTAGPDSYVFGFGNTTSGSNNKNWILGSPNGGAGNKSWALKMASTTNASNIPAKTLFIATAMNGSTNQIKVQAATYNHLTGDVTLFHNLSTNNVQTLQFSTGAVFNTEFLGNRMGNTLYGKPADNNVYDLFVAPGVVITVTDMTNTMARIMDRRGLR